MLNVKKRDGSLVPFDLSKIANAIEKALEDCGADLVYRKDSAPIKLSPIGNEDTDGTLISKEIRPRGKDW